MEEILRLEGIRKTYPEVVALKGVSFSLLAGEVHALVGENGAGKSTLVKIIGGIVPMDKGGTLSYKGTSTDITSPQQARDLGIAVIYQELTYVPELSVAENIFLGREPARAGLIDWKTLRRQAEEVLGHLGLRLDPAMKMKHLGTAQKQMVEIARALSMKADCIFMDEPTASLTEHEIRSLFGIIAELKSRGVTIVYISHRLEEIFEICDRVTVLRDGEWIGTRPTAELDIDRLIQMMVGREMSERYPAPLSSAGDEDILCVEGLHRVGQFEDISFTLKKGEILGFAGLMGAGRTEIARALFGAEPADAGEIVLKGQKVRPRSTRQALRTGIALVPEDRREQGLVPEMSVGHNITLGHLDGVCWAGVIDHRREGQVVDGYIRDLAIKTPSSGVRVKFLSGGNQQKVVVAKWLFIPSHLIIFDEPTRGIDVEAKYEIYALMQRLAADGIGVIMISSDLPELIGVCHRIIVVHEGRIGGVLRREEFSQERIMAYATGS